MQVEASFVKVAEQTIELVPVTRVVSSEVPRAKAVHKELLKGATATEWQQGLSSFINDGAVILSVGTDSYGAVRVDSRQQLQQGSADRCGSWTFASRLRRHC